MSARLPGHDPVTRLDLRPGAAFPPGCAERFNALAMQARAPFNRLIGELAPQGQVLLDWLVSAPGSRNTTCSQFFFRCCGLLLARELMERGAPPETVVTDSPAQAALLRSLSPAPEVVLAPPLVRQGLLRRPAVRALSDLALGLWAWAWARLTRPLARPLPDAPLLLLDAFLGSSDPDYDHYYPGLLDSLDAAERRGVVFAVTVAGVGFGGMPQVFARLRRAKRHLLPREDFLGLGDYFAAWVRALKTARLRLKPARFEGFAVAALAREELSDLTSFDQILSAFLNERFPARMAKAGLRVRTVVDWFENQAVDKGFNAGFRRSYPDARHLGYLGFLTSPLYLCPSPIAAERLAGALPRELRGIGPGSAEILLEFLPDAPFAPGPAFRYRQAFDPGPALPADAPFTVLLSLPMLLDDCRNILRLTASILDRLPRDVTLLVKRHPLVCEAALRQTFPGGWPERFVFAEGSFDAVVRRCRLLVSVTSGTSLEALARGIPVVIVGNPGGLTWDPVPAFHDADMHRLVHTADALLEAILEHRRADPQRSALHREAGKAFRQHYFTPVTRRTVRELLGLDVDGDAAQTH